MYSCNVSPPAKPTPRSPFVSAPLLLPLPSQSSLSIPADLTFTPLFMMDRTNSLNHYNKTLSTLSASHAKHQRRCSEFLDAPDGTEARRLVQAEIAKTERRVSELEAEVKRVRAQVEDCMRRLFPLFCCGYLCRAECAECLLRLEYVC